jgi:hypothetical protein
MSSISVKCKISSIEISQTMYALIFIITIILKIIKVFAVRINVS